MPIQPAQDLQESNTGNVDLVLAELALIRWRDEQLEGVTDQLERAFPELLLTIDAEVAQLSSWALAKTKWSSTEFALSVIEPWAQTQSEIIVKAAQESLRELQDTLGEGIGWSEHLTSGLSALGGVGLSAASAMAVPSLIALATIPAKITILGIGIGAATLSTPVLAAGGASIAVASIGGAKAVGHAVDKVRANLAQKLKDQTMDNVFGYKRAPSARCLLSDLQAAVLAGGEAILKGRVNDDPLRSSGMATVSSRQRIG